MSWVLRYYFEFVQSIVEIFLGLQRHYVRDLSIQIAIPGFVVVSVSIAMALGFVSTIRIDRSEGRLKGVTLGMTAIGIGLVTLLFTSQMMIRNFREARALLKLALMEKSSKQCQQEIFVIGQALTRYADAHDGPFPNSENWSDLLIGGRYLHDQKRLLWLANKRTWHCALNPDCDQDSPGEKVLLFESNPGWNRCGRSEGFVMKHRTVKGVGGYVFLKNGELKFVTADTVAQLVWE